MATFAAGPACSGRIGAAQADRPGSGDDAGAPTNAVDGASRDRFVDMAAPGAGGTPATSGTPDAHAGTGGMGGGAGGTPGAGGQTGAAGTPGTIWRPPLAISWQWQLTGTIDQTVPAQMFDVDLFDTPAATVAALRAAGHKVICYVSAGSFEDWRPDAAQFPSIVKGNPLDGWPGEQWLDVRRWDLLKPLIEARMDLCSSKGFDGIELDNVDGYTNDTGFPLTATDQLTFNRALAASAHARGLSVGLKNDLDQVGDLVASFDWALNEECFTYDECDLLRPFIAAGKPVLNVEYTMTPDQFCPQAKALGFSSLVKHLNLDAYRVACP
jgi:hypothetical protein